MRTIHLITFMVWAVGAVACGGDAVTGGTGGAGASGGSGGAGTGGQSATGGSAGQAGTGGSGGAAACHSTQTSDLAGVTITFPDQACEFTLAQAAAGIGIGYDVVVQDDLTGVIPQGQSSCPEAGPSGLYVFERLAGNGQSYCLCDTGLCPAPPEEPVTIAKGTTSGMFSWDGKSWSGPSDTGNPEGPAFPPGAYTLEVSAKGTRAGVPYSVVGTFGIVLTQ